MKERGKERERERVRKIGWGGKHCEAAFWKCMCVCHLWMTNELLPELIHSSSRLTHTGIRITCFCFCVSVNNNEAQNIMYHKKLPSQKKQNQHAFEANKCFFDRGNLSFTSVKVPVRDAIKILYTLMFQGKHFAELIWHNKHRPSHDWQNVGLVPKSFTLKMLFFIPKVHPSKMA